MEADPTVKLAVARTVIHALVSSPTHGASSGSGRLTKWRRRHRDDAASTAASASAVRSACSACSAWASKISCLSCSRSAFTSPASSRAMNTKWVDAVRLAPRLSSGARLALLRQRHRANPDWASNRLNTAGWLRASSTSNDDGPVAVAVAASHSVGSGVASEGTESPGTGAHGAARAAFEVDRRVIGVSRR